MTKYVNSPLRSTQEGYQNSSKHTISKIMYEHTFNNKLNNIL